MTQVVNCDCESFGIYRIIRFFIYQSASLHCYFAKFWTPHFFYFWTPHFFVWTPQFGWTPRLNYTMQSPRTLSAMYIFGARNFPPNAIAPSVPVIRLLSLQSYIFCIVLYIERYVTMRFLIKTKRLLTFCIRK